MKKSLILTVAATALLAVSCGKGSGGQKSWDKDAKAFMTQHLGEVLPYVAFDANSFVFEPEVDYYPDEGVVYGNFQMSDDNDKNLLTNYGKSLEKAGWTLAVPNESRSLGEGEDEYETYRKETKSGANCFRYIFASHISGIIFCCYYVISGFRFLSNCFLRFDNKT